MLQQDVVYPVMSQRAMTFVGGGARNFTEWFAFLGLVKVCAAQLYHLSGAFLQVQSIRPRSKQGGASFADYYGTHATAGQAGPKDGVPFSDELPCRGRDAVGHGTVEWQHAHLLGLCAALLLRRLPGCSPLPTGTCCCAWLQASKYVWQCIAIPALARLTTGTDIYANAMTGATTPAAQAARLQRAWAAIFAVFRHWPAGAVADHNGRALVGIRHTEGALQTCVTADNG